ncbi:MAG: hypothetical protein AB1324_01250 [Candidatus Micrarchaeota archaeon]
MKATLTHIGAVSLGRLLAIWSFVLGIILLVLWGLMSIVLALIGLAAGADAAAMVISIVIGVVMMAVGLVVFSIAMFVFGFLSAIVYNIILGVGGGIDIDLRERT